MEDFAKFLTKYASEAFGIAEALTTVLEGLALSPTQAAKVQEVIDKLQAIAGNVENYKPAKVVIKKEDIEAAVAKTLPKVLNDAVVKAVTEALAAKQAEDAKA